MKAMFVNDKVYIAIGLTKTNVPRIIGVYRSLEKANEAYAEALPGEWVNIREEIVKK